MGAKLRAVAGDDDDTHSPFRRCILPPAMRMAARPPVPRARGEPPGPGCPEPPPRVSWHPLTLKKGGSLVLDARGEGGSQAPSYEETRWTRGGALRALYGRAPRYSKHGSPRASRRISPVGLACSRLVGLPHLIRLPKLKIFRQRSTGSFFEKLPVQLARPSQPPCLSPRL